MLPISVVLLKKNGNIPEETPVIVDWATVAEEGGEGHLKR